MFLKKSQLILAGLLVVMASAGVSYAVSASVPSTLLAPGTTRYAFIQKANQLDLTTPQLYHWISAGVTTSVTIPAGKHADVITLFCSVAGTDSFIRVRAFIGSTLLEPSGGLNGVNLVMAPTMGQNECISFQKAGVSAGTKNVNVYWLGISTNSHLMNRSLVVILNIH